ncbi:hypothetical protein ACFL57_04890 [Candidatus Margulisiibacteriota bacterium]
MKNILKVLWVLVLVNLISANILLFINKTANGYIMVISAVLFILAFSSWIYISLRALYIKQKLTTALRFILAGNYETGIKLRGKYEDDVTILARLVNEVMDQLRDYDKLRAGRVAIHNKTIDIILRSIKEGLMIARVEKKVFQLNPAIQQVFEIEQGNITFEAMAKPDSNREFMALFDKVLNAEKIPQEATASIQLPIRNATRKLQLKLIPVKDAEENVKLVLIFAEPEIVESKKQM